MPTKSEKQIKAAAEALIHQGVNTVLVKMGSKGSMLVGESQNNAKFLDFHLKNYQAWTRWRSRWAARGPCL